MNDQTSNSYWLFFIFIIALLGFQMYMAYRQQKKQQTQLTNFQNSLKKGDEVVLTDGIYGTVESLSTDTAKVRIGSGLVIKVDRYAISRLAVKPAPSEVKEEEVPEKKDGGKEEEGK